MKRTLTGALAAVLLGANLTAHAQTADAALNALIKKGLLTEREAKDAVADLERQKGKTETSPYVLPWGKELKLKVGGFIQANAETGDVDAWQGIFSGPHERFKLRRARINLSGEFLEHFDFKIEGDFAQSDGLNKENGGGRAAFSGTDIFINWNQFPEANVRVGQFKAPFGLEQLTPDTTIYTIERSQPTGALTPEREVGVQLSGKPLASWSPDQKDLFDYAFGIFNGNNRNITVNDDANFMYAGRAGLTPFTGKLFGQESKWRIGGDAFTSTYAKGVRISQTGTLLLSPVDGSLSGFSAPSDARGTGWAVNQSFTLGPFDLIAEYLEQKIRPRHSTAFKEFTANGYYVQGSYFFPGKQFQLVSKWESFNPGQAQNDDLYSIIGGLNYYIKGDNIKLMLNYYHTWSDFRRTHPGTGDDQFDAAILRLQLMF